MKNKKQAVCNCVGCEKKVNPDTCRYYMSRAICDEHAAQADGYERISQRKNEVRRLPRARKKTERR